MPSSPRLQEHGQLCAAADAGPQSSPQVDRHACFEIFRAERVSLTAILFSGNNWRWRLRSAAGSILVNSEGYSSERECRAAIAALKENASSAKITGPAANASGRDNME